jgi:serine/threonine protein kinase/tetratricopeptide (TPR) repeat protein
MIGGKLGRYEILEVLGQGGQSIAYKARDPKIGRIVAVKQILSKKGLPEKERGEFLARFMREAQAAGRLSHPNIATIYDVGGDEAGEPYIAMEYVDGCDLDDLIQREHPLAQSRVLGLFVQLCSALDYAHDAGVVHRDIKPGNIMVTHGERVKVVDFGIAKMDSSNLTQAGMVMGTPSYMSPEQIMGKPLDRRSDIFSLGVVLYETLTGEKPFSGEHWTTVSFKIVNERHAPLLSCKRGPTLLPDFDSILDKALAKAPADRYQTCAELGGVLELLLHDARLASPSTIGVSATESGAGEASGVPSGATVSLKRQPMPGDARGLHGNDSTAITPGALPTGKDANTVPPADPPAGALEESEGRLAPAVVAGGTASPVSSATPPPSEWSFTISKVGPATGPVPAAMAAATDAGHASSPSKRRGSIVRLAAVAAIAAFIVVSALFATSRIRREPPPPPAAAAPQVVPLSPAATAPSSATDALRSAREALRQGLIIGRDGNDAMHFVTVALALDPDDADARALEAEVRAAGLRQVDELRKQGKSAQVEKAWDMLVEDFPDDAEIQAKHDAAQARQSRTQLASDSERTRVAGENALTSGNHNEAATQFVKLTRIDPSNAPAFYSLGRANLGQGNLVEAEKNLAQACLLDPRNATYNIQLSVVLEKNKKLAGALGYLEKGIELGGDRENSTASLKARASTLRFRIDLGPLVPHTFLSKHVHRFLGRCNGQLVVTESGFSFISDEEKDHSTKAGWEEVNGFAILNSRLEVELKGGRKLTFECAELDRMTKIAEVLSNHR